MQESLRAHCEEGAAVANAVQGDLASRAVLPPLGTDSVSEVILSYSGMVVVRRDGSKMSLDPVQDLIPRLHSPALSWGVEPGNEASFLLAL